MANLPINILEFERLAEKAVMEFFEDYKSRHLINQADYPMDRLVVEWLDDLHDFLTIETFGLPASPLSLVVDNSDVDE